MQSSAYFINKKTAYIYSNYYNKLCEIIKFKIYYDELIKYKTKSNDWQALTLNAYLDSIVSNWCQIFGTNNEGLHWKKIFSFIKMDNLYQKVIDAFGIEFVNTDIEKRNKEEKFIKSFILKETSFSEEKYEKIWEKAKHYFDNCIKHTNTDITINEDTNEILYEDKNKIRKAAFRPLFKELIKIASALLILLIRIFNMLPKIPDVHLIILPYNNFDSEDITVDLIEERAKEIYLKKMPQLIFPDLARLF